MRRVFVDTGAFFALLVADDHYHLRARRLFEEASQDSWSLFTTNAVVWETYTLLQKRARNGHVAGMTFLDAVDEGFCQVERIQPIDEERPTDLLRSHSDKEYSFCDALSFAVMERLRLDAAMSFDQDFESCGKFTLL